MSIFKVLFELFILYILYKVIFDFIIPIYHTTRKIKQKMGDMQNQMNGQQGYNQNQPTSGSFTGEKKPNRTDYIDFEEVK